MKTDSGNSKEESFVKKEASAKRRASVKRVASVKKESNTKQAGSAKKEGFAKQAGSARKENFVKETAFSKKEAFVKHGVSGDEKTEKAAEKTAAMQSGSGIKCPVSRKCGGCSAIGRDYSETLKEKEELVRRWVKSYADLEGIVGMDDPYHYRNKVHAAFAHVKDGRKERNVSGIYQEGTHKVVQVKDCLIEDKKADVIILDILDMLRSFKIKVYDEDTEYGLLRHVLVRTAHATGEIMVVLVMASPIFPGKNNFIKALLEKHPDITTVILNINDKHTSYVLGEKESVIYGKGYIEDVLCGLRFRISSKSFYQVNSVQTEKLYGKAIAMANLTGHERVVDAYCGIGTIGIIAAGHAKEVIGVESNKDAIKDAGINAALNNIRNISFYENDASIFMKNMADRNERIEVLFMDPPRTGSTEEFMASAIMMSPGRIVYISCNPETLSRDLNYLTVHGYKAKEARAFDMFPFTAEVETVVLLVKSGLNNRK
ncbi:MAG TPA: 23S rRNA (uracil(1939)-C(5))-methyltransferase RlmD [Lachnospiraceae bacterium]|nr:23S rRNA (uracil(1939)-C(5))-methyltransferase RlmD [Lachnospiraceae bacterium]